MQSIIRPALRVVSVLIVGLLGLTAAASPLSAQEQPTVPTDSARYRVEFVATWSEVSHPHPENNFPTAGAHFSPLIGAVHNADVVFWKAGELASAGMEQMAETGATALLTGEIGTAIDNGSARAAISGGDALSPGSAVIAEVAVSLEHPLVTLVTMIAPSPDWFVGVRGESLLDEDGQWVTERAVTLYPYDAGTDSGSDYVSPNADTDPAELIRTLRSRPPFSAAPMGTFTFTRVDELRFSVYMPVALRE